MKKIFASVIAVAVCSVMVGCSRSAPLYKSPYFFAMGADAAYVIPSAAINGNNDSYYPLYTQTRDALADFDRSLSSTIPDSTVSRFNEASAGSKVKIDKISYEVLSLAKKLYSDTDGYYNPAVYYNVTAYGFGGAEAYPDSADKLPSDDDIAQYNVLSSAFGQIELYEEGGEYFAEKPDVTVTVGGVTLGMKIDLGGLGKGYAVDKVDTFMDEHGKSYGYFSFGESSIAFKKFISKDESMGESYILGLSNPRYKSGSVSRYARLSVKDVTVSTSGDNVQWYEVDGVRYCHIIDPLTGKPVQTGIMTATVIGGGAAENDAYTTAIMAMGKERAVRFINEHLSDRKVIFTYDGASGYEIITNIPVDELSIEDGGFKIANTVDGEGKIVLEM